MTALFVYKRSFTNPIKHQTMKKITALLLAALLGSTLALAQTKDRSYDEFHGHWFIGIQGGIGQTVGETSFGNLISPAAAFSFGYQFTPVWGLRAGLSGWQAKGAAVAARTHVYKFNYLQGNVDVLVDLCGIAGYRMSRAVNPYIFAGVGVNGAFNNGEAQDLGPYLPKDNLLWDGSRVFPVGRFGAGMGVRLTDAVHFNIEVNGNFLSDRFNSKKGSAVDWQLGALAGFTFRIGLKKEKPAEVIPVAEPEPEPQPAPAPEPEPQPEPQPEPVVEEPAPAPFEAVTRDIYFTIGRSEIRGSETAKLDEVIALLKENPQTKVTVTGHADAETGSESRNMELSEERAENVAAAIKAAGIASDRVYIAYKGDRENPFDTPEKNRVAICVVAE